MKITRRHISTVLAGIGAVCLAAAVVLVIRQIIDDKNSQNTIDQLRDFAESRVILSTCSYPAEQGRFAVVTKEVESEDKYLPLARDDAQERD